MKLTMKMLEQMGACLSARERFSKLFGEEAEVADVVKALHNADQKNWKAWLLSQNNPQLIEALVSSGVDVRANNDMALREAARYGRLDIVKFLVKNGANVHANDNKALRNAASHGYLDVVEFLVESGANVHADNDAALRDAAYRDRVAVVKFLESKMMKKR